MYNDLIAHEILKAENVWEDKTLIHIFTYSHTMQARYFYSRWVVYYGVRKIWYWTIRSRTSRYEDNSVPDNSALGQFGTRTIWSRTYACKTLKSGFFWYAFDTNLFRLGSTNPKKKIPRPGRPVPPPRHFFFVKNVLTFLNKIFFLSF